MFWQLLLQVILIFLNAVFACAEIAVISINDAKLDKLASSGDKRAKRLKSLTNQPSRFLATIQVAITLSGFIGSAFAADNFAEPLARAAVNLGIPLSESVLKSISVVLITLVLSYFTLIFGELVPKRLAMKKSESLALGMSGLISFISKLFAPIVWLLNISTNAVLHLLGIDPEGDDNNVTEEEILMMSDAGAEKGTIDEEDNRIIKNIFAFDDLTVDQVCTHRTEVKYLSIDESDEEWCETIYKSRHSKFPVCGSKIDNVLGILDVRDYFCLDDKSKESVMKNAVKEPYFVHEYMKADVLFDNMKKHDADHFAVVIDEYGGVNGIVTVTDLVEKLVGDFSEVLPDEMSEKIEKTGENEWCASGIVPLTEAAQALKIDLPTDKFDTVGGYLMSFSGSFPKDNTMTFVETDVLKAEIIQVRNHRIEKCLLKVKIDEKLDNID